MIPTPQYRTGAPLTAPAGTRRRAALILATAAVTIAVLVLGLVVVLRAGPTPAPADPTPPAPPSAPPSASAVPGQSQGWDLAGQTEVATRPMPTLPQGAALPQPLSTDQAGPALRLPEPTSRGGLVPRGFPPTPEGALAQLVALTSAGLLNADPQAYATAYAALAAPGAPPVEATPLHRGLVEIRARAGLPASGAVPGLTFDWTPAAGLIKGSTDQGRYVVVCVLGQLDSGANGRLLSTGAGDCQAMRFVDGQWWISPGAAAAPPTLAWPGSAAAAQAGYRTVSNAA